MNKVYIAHHGIFGQKWGRRRYQNKDGSLTPAGELRYNKGTSDSKNYTNLPGKKGTYKVGRRTGKTNQQSSPRHVTAAVLATSALAGAGVYVIGKHFQSIPEAQRGKQFLTLLGRAWGVRV